MDGAIWAECTVDHTTKVVGRHERCREEDKNEQDQYVQSTGANARSIVVHDNVLPLNVVWKGCRFDSPWMVAERVHLTGLNWLSDEPALERAEETFDNALMWSVVKVLQNSGKCKEMLVSKTVYKKITFEP